MAFFAHSETQGMAYQECLAMNVPVFAWDEGTWPDPIAAKLGSGAVACTSVPYFSSECGMTFTAANMAARWEEFRGRIPLFRPRDYVARHLTLADSAAAYLAAYAHAQATAGC
jgi:hypothetical protein